MEEVGVLDPIQVFKLRWLLGRPGSPVPGLETLLLTRFRLIRAQSQAWPPPAASPAMVPRTLPYFLAPGKGMRVEGTGLSRGQLRVC